MTEENLNLNVMQPCESHFSDRNHPIALSGGEGCCFNEKNQPQATTKKKDYIVYTFSHIYAQLFATIAVIAVFTEILHERKPANHFFIHIYVYLYLLSGSFVIFIWGFVNSVVHKFNKVKNLIDEYHLVASWYFDLGLLVCGLAVFACTCLKSVAALYSANCMSSAATALCILNGIFIVLQMHFFYSKNMRYISSCFQSFSVMHLTATNAAFWLYLVLWESSIDFQDSKHVKHNSTLSWSQKDLNISVHSVEADTNSLNQSDHFPVHAIHFTSNCWWRIPESELSVDILSIQLCLQHSSVGMFWKKISEYLYPFAVQYYLIVLFLLCISEHSFISKFKKLYSSSVSVECENNNRYCFCLSKGFYLGCVYFIVSLVIVIFYFIFNIENIDIIIMSMLCIIYASGIFAAVIGLCQMKSVAAEIMDPLSYYHEIGVYFIYAYGTSDLFVGSFSEEKYKSLLLIIKALLMILHAIAQYTLIKSVSKSRQAVNFLILCNASLWLLESFVYCYKTSEDIHLKIYDVAWPIMNRILIPCITFYRFVSVMLLSNLSKYLSAEYC